MALEGQVFITSNLPYGDRERERETEDRDTADTQTFGRKKKVIGHATEARNVCYANRRQEGTLDPLVAVISGSVYAFHGARGFTSRRVER